VIGIFLSVPVACWRKGHAREFVETEGLPSPATCYGALLSLVGEEDRERHRGCGCSAGLVNEPAISTVLRTRWRIKDKKTPQGVAENARPDFQQLVLQSKLVVWCDRSGESTRPTLEDRVRAAFLDPSSLTRFGGWSLGESTHLINDATLLTEADPVPEHQLFLTHLEGDITLPVWVDHVGAAGTKYAVGCIERCSARPDPSRLPRVPLVDATPPSPHARLRRKGG
jgi:CRISPR-associated protein Cas5t